jgi:micrococcal nuclease
MLRRIVTLLLLAAVTALGGRALLDGGAAGGQTLGSARVERVVDGDTIVLAGGERVRYIGVDTPESVKPNSPVECFAKRSARANAELVDGRKVELRYDAEPRDRYGRLLAYVYVPGPSRLFVNAELVRRGYAKPLTIPPNVAHAAQFRRLARQARRDGRGLWSAC